MSTVIAKNVQVGTSGTAAQNFTLYQPASPDGTVRLANGNSGTTTDLVTVTSAGNVGIGTSSPSNFGGVNFQVQNSSIGSILWSNGTCTGQLLASASAEVTVGSRSNHPLRFGTNDTERGRFDTSGYFLLGKTSATTSSKLEVDASSNVAQFWHTNSSDTIGIYMRHGRGLSGFSGKMVSFRRNDNTEVGSIVIGDSSTSYNTSSDYRLKNSIAPMTGALAKVALLKPCTYKWNSSGFDGEGFIAHELAEVVPQCVSGDKDAVDAEGNPKYQGIDTSFLVATLTAAIQELKAEFDAYKSTHP
jgi:hypothetical protein